MGFVSSKEQREEILLACRVLTHFHIVEGFGHVSIRIAKNKRILMTPRSALGLVSEGELIELELDGRQTTGDGRPALETAMHLAIYRRRPDVNAIVRGHPRHVAAYACAGEPLKIAHGFGTNLGAVVPIFPQPGLVASAEMADAVADALGTSEAIILQSNGMLAVGNSVPHACVRALFMEETATVQLLASAAGLKPRFYSPAEAAHRHGQDHGHEPLRAWDYYVAMAEGTLM